MAVVVNGFKNKSMKLWHAVGLTLVVIAAVLAPSVYGRVYPDTNGADGIPLKFLDGSLTPTEVSWGQSVQIKRKVKWLANCEQVINSREIVDSQRVVHKLDPDYIRPPKLADLDTDRIVNSDKPMVIPSYLPPGKMGYRVTTCATCRELSKEPVCVVAPVLEVTVRAQ